MRRLMPLAFAAAWLVLSGCGQDAGAPPPEAVDGPVAPTTPLPATQAAPETLPDRDTPAAVGGGAEAECSGGAQCAPGANPDHVPDVVGMGVGRAVIALRNRGYGCAVAAGLRMGGADGRGRRRVVAQDPEPGAAGSKGEDVLLAVSRPYAGGRVPPGTGCVDVEDEGFTERGLEKVFRRDAN